MSVATRPSGASVWSVYGSDTIPLQISCNIIYYVHRCVSLYIQYMCESVCLCAPFNMHRPFHERMNLSKTFLLARIFRIINFPETNAVVQLNVVGNTAGPVVRQPRLSEPAWSKRNQRCTLYTFMLSGIILHVYIFHLEQDKKIRADAVKHYSLPYLSFIHIYCLCVAYSFPFSPACFCPYSVCLRPFLHKRIPYIIPVLRVLVALHKQHSNAYKSSRKWRRSAVAEANNATATTVLSNHLGPCIE